MFLYSALGICFIGFLPHIYDTNSEERNQTIKLIEEVWSSKKGSPISFLWAQGGDHFELEEAFSLGSGYPSALAISFAKKKYSVMRGSFTKSNIESFIRGLMAGKEALYNLAKEPTVKEVNPWDGQDARPHTEEDDVEKIDF